MSLSRAVALGALHGPAELLPVSSSGHTAIVPWLLGWDFDRLDGQLRKAFEVALHAGTATALVITARAELRSALRRLNRRGLALIGLSVAPPAVVGYALERPIERRLGTPATIAAGLVAGAIAMAVADRAPEVRPRDQVATADAIWLGLAQACALVPGVSRNGATLTTARLRGFTRQGSSRLSQDVALPVIIAASALESVRLHQRESAHGERTAVALGALTAFLSSLVCAPLLRLLDRSLLPFAAYRAVLAVAVMHLCRSRSRRSPTICA